MVDAPTFWAGRRVLVTGHTGFKGAWLALWLERLGSHVAGLALAPQSRPSLYEDAGLDAGIDSHLVDLRDAAGVRGAVEATRPEIVFHLAAQSLVRRSYREPVETFATNVMGTVHLLDALRDCESVRAVVVVTTDKCYENREWVWGYREDDALGGHDPYAASKAAAEIAVAAYRRSFLAERAVALATARAGNVIGGGDWSEDRLVPDMVQAFAAGRPVEIRNPRAIRPWQHVLDPLAGYLLLAQRLYVEGPAHAEAWNFGPGEHSSKPVGEVVERFAAAWGDGAQWQAIEAHGPHESTWLELDASKARRRLCWRPQLDLDSALEWTARWYRAHAERPRSARALCLADIARYENRNGGRA